MRLTPTEVDRLFTAAELAARADLELGDGVLLRLDLEAGGRIAHWRAQALWAADASEEHGRQAQDGVVGENVRDGHGKLLLRDRARRLSNGSGLTTSCQIGGQNDWPDTR